VNLLGLEIQVSWLPLDVHDHTARDLHVYSRPFIWQRCLVSCFLSLGLFVGLRNILVNLSTRRGVRYGFVVLNFAAPLPPSGALLSAASSDGSHDPSDVSCSFSTFAVLALISKITYWGTYHNKSCREFQPCSAHGASP
jgi:hypothetical protein